MFDEAGRRHRVVNLLLELGGHTVNVHFLHADPVFPYKLGGLFQRGIAAIPHVPEVVFWHGLTIQRIGNRLFQIDRRVRRDFVIQSSALEQCHQLRGLFRRDHVFVKGLVFFAVHNARAVAGHEIPKPLLRDELRREHIQYAPRAGNHAHSFLNRPLNGAHIPRRNRNLTLPQQRSIHIQQDSANLHGFRLLGSFDGFIIREKFTRVNL